MPIDTLQLYRWSVQDPATHARLISIIFQRVRGAAACRVLREDFSGTAADAIAWVGVSPQRRAIAVDLDGQTLQWARESAARILGEGAEHIRFIESDVMAAGPPELPPADVTTALNFSLFYFHQRGALLAYLRHARSALSEQGLLIFNAFGGPGAMRLHTESHTVNPPASATVDTSLPSSFTYHWEQRSYDAATNRVDCRIHFTIPASDPAAEPVQIRDAFRYDYRLWTLPELVELAREAGFVDAQIWRHTYDPAKGAKGVFLGPVEHIGPVGQWTAYIVAVR